jgi:T-complex protein 1 subunit eta
MENYVWEPTLVKLNALTAAVEACCLILSIDETVRNPQSEVAQAAPGGGTGGKGMKGMMGGRGGGMGRGVKAFRGRGGR